MASTMQIIGIEVAATLPSIWRVEIMNSGASTQYLMWLSSSASAGEKGG
jgi:hypothetical protein